MTDSNVAELLSEVKALKKRVTELEDINEIRSLQYKYGYYLDKCISFPKLLT
jgi:hypothetical protein